jgi:hypothetical protein
MRLVERGRMDDRSRLPHAPRDESLVPDRSDLVGERGRLNVEAQGWSAFSTQVPHHGLPEVARASSHQHRHLGYLGDEPVVINELILEFNRKARLKQQYGVRISRPPERDAPGGLAKIMRGPRMALKCVRRTSPLRSTRICPARLDPTSIGLRTPQDELTKVLMLFANLIAG